MAGHLCFDRITRRFGSFAAASDVTVKIQRGEIFSLLGPSGCGKTTLLRLAAGFDRPDHGRVLLDGRDITPLPPDRRPVNTVFQNYALFPHLSVRENIAFGPRIARKSKAAVRDGVDRMLSLVDLGAHADKKPAQLSGGQKQRVAIARALVNEPEVLLLDEPLAALDLKLRQRLLAELRAIHRQIGGTFVYVTHDQGEAMSFSHRIAVMNRGRVEQAGTPEEIYGSPRTSFVASFIGDTNFLSGMATAGGEMSCVVEVAGLGPVKTRAAGPAAGEMRLSLRPENVELLRNRPEVNGSNVFQGVVEETAFFGSHSRCTVRCGELRIVSECRGLAAPPPAGEPVWLRWEPGDAYLLEE